MLFFFKPSLENFLSQQRETQTHTASEQQAFPRRLSELGTQDLICEWPSVQSRVTMWLIDENLHCLCARPQRSHCTKGVLSQPLVFVGSTHLYRDQVKIYWSKVIHVGDFINISRAISLFGSFEILYQSKMIILCFLPVMVK